jgi:hypothetical protein
MLVFFLVKFLCANYIVVFIVLHFLYSSVVVVGLADCSHYSFRSFKNTGSAGVFVTFASLIFPTLLNLYRNLKSTV